MMGEEMEGSADARRQLRVYTTLLEIVEERGNSHQMQAIVCPTT